MTGLIISVVLAVHYRTPTAMPMSVSFFTSKHPGGSTTGNWTVCGWRPGSSASTSAVTPRQILIYGSELSTTEGSFHPFMLPNPDPAPRPLLVGATESGFFTILLLLLRAPLHGARAFVRRAGTSGGREGRGSHQGFPFHLGRTWPNWTADVEACQPGTLNQWSSSVGCAIYAPCPATAEGLATASEEGGNGARVPRWLGLKEPPPSKSVKLLKCRRKAAPSMKTPATTRTRERKTGSPIQSQRRIVDMGATPLSVGLAARRKPPPRLEPPHFVRSTGRMNGTKGEEPRPASVSSNTFVR